MSSPNRSSSPSRGGPRYRMPVGTGANSGSNSGRVGSPSFLSRVSSTGRARDAGNGNTSEGTGSTGRPRRVRSTNGNPFADKNDTFATSSKGSKKSSRSGRSHQQRQRGGSPSKVARPGPGSGSAHTQRLSQAANASAMPSRPVDVDEFIGDSFTTSVDATNGGGTTSASSRTSSDTGSRSRSNRMRSDAYTSMADGEGQALHPPLIPARGHSNSGRSGGTRSTKKVSNVATKMQGNPQKTSQVGGESDVFRHLQEAVNANTTSAPVVVRRQSTSERSKRLEQYTQEVLNVTVHQADALIQAQLRNKQDNAGFRPNIDSYEGQGAPAATGSRVQFIGESAEPFSSHRNEDAGNHNVHPSSNHSYSTSKNSSNHNDAPQQMSTNGVAHSSHHDYAMGRNSSNREMSRPGGPQQMSTDGVAHSSHHDYAMRKNSSTREMSRQSEGTMNSAGVEKPAYVTAQEEAIHSAHYSHRSGSHLMQQMPQAAIVGSSENTRSSAHAEKAAFSMSQDKAAHSSHHSHTMSKNSSNYRGSHRSSSRESSRKSTNAQEVAFLTNQDEVAHFNSKERLSVSKVEQTAFMTAQNEVPQSTSKPHLTSGQYRDQQAVDEANHETDGTHESSTDYSTDRGGGSTMGDESSFEFINVPRASLCSRIHSLPIIESLVSVVGSVTGAVGAVVDSVQHFEVAAAVQSLRGPTPPPKGKSDEHYHVLEENEEDRAIRSLASKLGPDWRLHAHKPVTAALSMRVRDFQFARAKRREEYGSALPDFGLFGMYEHLSGLRIDIEWAEEAAFRRKAQEPYVTWRDYDDARMTGIESYDNVPMFTYLAMLLCTAAFFTSIAANGWKFQSLKENPMIGPSVETLILLGAKQSNLIVNNGESWRLITAMYLHGGLIHFMVNMISLYFIGGAVERSHGSIKAAILFILPAVGGTILSAIFLPDFVTVGASGGIFGYMGAAIADIWQNKDLLFSSEVNTDSQSKYRHYMVLLVLGADIFGQCLLGLTPAIDNFTHIGAMSYGFVCGKSTMKRLSMKLNGGQEKEVKFRVARRIMGLLSAVGVLFVSFVVLMTGDGRTSPCEVCRYVSCIPFPMWGDVYDKWWYCDSCDAAWADLHFNEDYGFYDELLLHCPGDGNTTVYINIEDQMIADKSSIHIDFPMYCREYCYDNDDDASVDDYEF